MMKKKDIKHKRTKLKLQIMMRNKKNYKKIKLK